MRKQLIESYVDSDTIVSWHESLVYKPLFRNIHGKLPQSYDKKINKMRYNFMWALNYLIWNFTVKGNDRHTVIRKLLLTVDC